MSPRKKRVADGLVFLAQSLTSSQMRMSRQRFQTFVVYNVYNVEPNNQVAIFIAKENMQEERGSGREQRGSRFPTNSNRLTQLISRSPSYQILSTAVSSAGPYSVLITIKSITSLIKQIKMTTIIITIQTTIVMMMEVALDSIFKCGIWCSFESPPPMNFSFKPLWPVQPPMMRLMKIM